MPHPDRDPVSAHIPRMTGHQNVVTRSRNTQGRTKVKTGCKTCRTRRIKCDEIKPFCNRCRSTGRNCDGYESSFRSWETPSISNVRASMSDKKSNTKSRSVQLPVTGVTPQDIDLLNRYLSTKTLFDIEMECHEEASQVLEASLTDLSIQHAVSSLRALRQDLEASGDGPKSVSRPSPAFSYGLQQYNMALRGLASNMSSPSSGTLKSAILCCQIFVSIEQVQKNYSAMAQHIIRGLRIMHAYRARPCLVDRKHLIPANKGQLPFLDVFIIKLFSAPCKFADSPAEDGVGGKTPSLPLNKSHEESQESRSFRIILPDMRTRLTRIAALTVEFLDKVSQVASVEAALRLTTEKSVLLVSLASWLEDVELVQTRPEPISVAFLRIFRLILKIVLLGALDHLPNTDAGLQTHNDQLQSLANDVGEKVKTYVTCKGNGS